MTQRIVIALGGLAAAGVLALGLVAVGFGPAGSPATPSVLPATTGSTLDPGTIGVDPTQATITDEVTRSLARSGLELKEAGTDASAGWGEVLDSGVGGVTRSRDDDDGDEGYGEHDDD